MDIAMLRDMHREMTFEKVMETVPVYIETEFVGRTFSGSLATSSSMWQACQSWCTSP